MRKIAVVLLFLSSVTAASAKSATEVAPGAAKDETGAPSQSVVAPPAPIAPPLSITRPAIQTPPAPPAPPPIILRAGAAPASVPAAPSLSSTHTSPDALGSSTLPPADFRPPLDLSQARLYVYDFLDIREKVFQPKVLDEIERQLLELLTPQTQAVTILRSQKTPFALKRDADNWQADISTEHEVDRVPVGQTIASNLSAEDQFQADHQLILFPSSFTVRGVWRFYTIRFVLVRKADRKTWQYYYEGGHAVMLTEGERSQSRAQKIIEKLQTAMTAGGLTRAAIPEQKQAP